MDTHSRTAYLAFKHMLEFRLKHRVANARYLVDKHILEFRMNQAYT